jgi:PTS system mannose-specific IIB component/fructoselysine and glucoselysine-specific PTS system IIB component
MPILLFRVDERLIHGQVVVGWGGPLRPDRIVVVDDELAGSVWEQELYTLGLPPEIDAEFIRLEAARAELSAWRQGMQRVIILTRDIRTMRLLASGGLLSGEEVNIGGVHCSPGRRPILSYLFLTPEEEDELRLLAAEGVSISARDLPGARRVELPELLRGSPRDR